MDLARSVDGSCLAIVSHDPSSDRLFAPVAAVLVPVVTFHPLTSSSRPVPAGARVLVQVGHGDPSATAGPGRRKKLRRRDHPPRLFSDCFVAGATVLPNALRP